MQSIAKATNSLINSTRSTSLPYSLQCSASRYPTVQVATIFIIVIFCLINLIKATLQLKKLQVNEQEKYKRWLLNKYTYEQIYDWPELILEVGDGGGGPLPDNLAFLEKNLAESDSILKNQRKKNILHKALKFEYAPRIKRITVRMNKKAIKGVTFDETLQFMLGFPRNTLLTKRHNTATYNVDISARINSFFIYCNIVEPQFVGNALKPLLRMIPVAEGQLGTVVNKELLAILRRNKKKKKILRRKKWQCLSIVAARRLPNQNWTSSLSPQPRSL